MRQIGKPYKRKNKSGWWLAWTDPTIHKVRTKSFPTKQLADHYRQILYYQFNADVFIGQIINVSLSQAKEEYLKKYALRGFKASSQYEAGLSIKHFEDFLGTNVGTQYLSQKHFDDFILARKEKVSAFTVNKDISNLRAFVNWASKPKIRYLPNDIELHKLKTSQTSFKALDDDRIKKLFKDAPTPEWFNRILLSLVTGLRSSDIDNLDKADIDIKTRSIDSKSQKTGKVYIGRPLPDAAIPALKSYLKSLPKGQVKLFADVNVRKAWDSFSGDITRQDLRKTFATLIQKVGSIGTAQNLLEHYDKKTTTKFYTDEELILRWKINQLPVKIWIGDKKI